MAHRETGSRYLETPIFSCMALPRPQGDVWGLFSVTIAQSSGRKGSPGALRSHASRSVPELGIDSPPKSKQGEREDAANPGVLEHEFPGLNGGGESRSLRRDPLQPRETYALSPSACL